MPSLPLAGGDTTAGIKAKWGSMLTASLLPDSGSFVRCMAGFVAASFVGAGFVAAHRCKDFDVGERPLPAELTFGFGRRKSWRWRFMELSYFESAFFWSRGFCELVARPLYAKFVTYVCRWRWNSSFKEWSFVESAFF